MFHFFLLCRKNFLKATALSGIIFFSLMLIFLIALAISKNDWQEFHDISTLAMLPLFSIGLALFCILLAFFTEYNEFNNLQKIFHRIPFSELSSIGFRKTQLFANSFWKLYKEVYCTAINGYTVVADVQTKGNLSFTVLANNYAGRPLQSPEQYREVQVYATSAGVVLKIPVDAYSTPSLDAMQNMLADLTTALHRRNITPSKDLSGYEDMLKVAMFQKGLRAGVGG